MSILTPFRCSIPAGIIRIKAFLLGMGQSRQRRKWGKCRAGFAGSTDNGE